jgi:cobalamin synthase
MRSAIMKDQTLGAIAVGFLVVGTVGAAWMLHTVTSSKYYCPGPSASVVVPLLAPCQAFAAAVVHDVSGVETVRIALPALGLSPAEAKPPGTQLAEK